MYLPFDPPYPKSIIAYDSTIAPQCLSHPDLAREDVPEEAEGIVQRFVINVTVQISDLKMRMRMVRSHDFPMVISRVAPGFSAIARLSMLLAMQVDKRLFIQLHVM